ncbi:hypothetical protein L1887_44771 [Cichorium endivia]|nr:hypothetical protein L1887_44771 [Cichorium endivia]
MLLRCTLVRDGWPTVIMPRADHRTTDIGVVTSSLLNQPCAVELPKRGCTANDWVDAASGIMQAKDNQEKDARNQRIKSANKAAGY